MPTAALIAVIVVDNTGKKKYNLLVDVVFVTDGEGPLTSFLFFVKPDDVT